VTGARPKLLPLGRGDVALLLLPSLLLILLLALLPSDPPPGMTLSTSPYTDEAWNVVNARNFVLLGTWSTDQWNLHLLTLPFSLTAAVVFQLFGVGIIQARVVAVICSVLAVGFLTFAVRRQFGRAAAVVAGAGVGGSALMLYYGHLVYLETMVIFFLCAGTWALLRGALSAAKDGVTRSAIGWGLLAGVLLATAALSKVSAAFAVGGLLAGAALAAWHARDRALGVVAAAIGGSAVVGIGWLALVALPRWDRILTDLRIWPDQLSTTKPFWELATSYLTESDHGVPLLWLLLVSAVIGLALSMRSWSRLDTGQRLMVGSAVGWFVVGMTLLLVVPYRPNRYLVPLLPPLAILAASGVARVIELLPPAATRARLLAPAIVTVGLIIPGIVAYAGWLQHSQSRLSQIQRMTEAIVPPGATVQGDLAALFAMRVPATVIVQRRGVLNDADLYDTYHVRWVVASSSAPRWAPLHSAAWQDREVIFCTEWGPTRPCLIHVP
jgi:4-amino-4-deoxy-L-arabinose transferase-like glycosyltransferase